MLFERQTARKPNLYPWTEEFIKRMWHGFWTPDEFTFLGDLGQFKTEMTPQEQQIIIRCLSAIGQVEIAVKTFWGRLGDNLPHPGISDLGFVMAHTEVIHNKAYEKLLDVLGMESIFEENLSVPVVRDRVNYLRKHQEKVYSDERKQYIYSIILFTLFVENVSLFSQFYVVLWFNRNKNMLKDTAQQVQYTRNEETLHSQIGIRLVNTLRDEYPELFDQELEDLVVREIRAALISEGQLIDWMVGDFNEKDLSASVLKAYIAQRMNDSLVAIGYKPLFEPDAEMIKATQWMEIELIGNNQTDFFHKKPVEYSKKNKPFNPEELF